jgi:hypothetical protein
MMNMTQITRRVVPLAVTLAVSVAIFGRVSGQSGQPAPPARTRIDVSRLGPQVGERVPDFALKDQSGQTQTLRSIMRPKGAMLVFIRSADW